MPAINVEVEIKAFGAWLRQGVDDPVLASDHPDIDFSRTLHVLALPVGKAVMREILALVDAVPTSAGVAFYRTASRGGPSVLLVHATNSSWSGSTLSIPKGHIEAGEAPLAAAMREVKEEVGIDVAPPFDTKSQEVNNTDRKGRVTKRLIYYVVNADAMPIPDVIPKDQLQLEEVDWAGFVALSEAPDRVVKYQLGILKAIEVVTGPAHFGNDPLPKSEKVDAVWKVTPRDRRGGGIPDRRVMAETPSGVSALFLLDKGTTAEIDWLYRRFVLGVPLEASDPPASVRARSLDAESAPPVQVSVTEDPSPAAGGSLRDVALNMLGTKLAALEGEGWAVVALPPGRKVTDEADLLKLVPGAKVQQLHTAGVTLAKPLVAPKTGPQVTSARRAGADWMPQVAAALELTRDKTLSHLKGHGFEGYEGTWINANVFDPKGHVETTYSKSIGDKPATFHIAVRRTETGKLEVRSTYTPVDGVPVVRRWTPLQEEIDPEVLFPDEWVEGVTRMVTRAGVEHLPVVEQLPARSLGPKLLSDLTLGSENYGIFSAFRRPALPRSQSKQKHGELVALVQERGWRWYDIMGGWQDSTGKWWQENTVLVRDVTFDEVRDLAWALDQDAFIWQDESGTVAMYSQRPGKQITTAMKPDGTPALRTALVPGSRGDPTQPGLYSGVHGGWSFSFDFDWDNPIPWDPVSGEVWTG